MEDVKERSMPRYRRSGMAGESGVAVENSLFGRHGAKSVTQSKRRCCQWPAGQVCPEIDDAVRCVRLLDC
jgi:hypothetical protein